MPSYQRILLKLSGEALMGDDAFGINRATIVRMVEEIAEVTRLGVQVAIVIGGGNAKLIEDLPPGVRLGNNLTAFRGGMRLWALESIHTHAAGVADAPLPEAQPREWCVI